MEPGVHPTRSMAGSRTMGWHDSGMTVRPSLQDWWQGLPGGLPTMNLRADRRQVPGSPSRAGRCRRFCAAAHHRHPARRARQMMISRSFVQCNRSCRDPARRWRSIRDLTSPVAFGLPSSSGSAGQRRYQTVKTMAVQTIRTVSKRWKRRWCRRPVPSTNGESGQDVGLLESLAGAGMLAPTRRGPGKATGWRLVPRS
jgi:hypothetical protein